MNTTETAEAEAILRAIGSEPLVWVDAGLRRLESRGKDYWYAIEGFKKMSGCVATILEPVDGKHPRKGFRSVADAKDACARHLLTGQWA